VRKKSKIVSTQVTCLAYQPALRACLLIISGAEQSGGTQVFELYDAIAPNLRACVSQSQQWVTVGCLRCAIAFSVKEAIAPNLLVSVSQSHRWVRVRCLRCAIAFLRKDAIALTLYLSVSQSL
jgi:hypothetical protein